MNAVDRDIFSQLPDSTRQELLKLGAVCTAEKGTVLFEERTKMPNLSILLDGYVCLYRSSYQGESRAIFVCSKGEFLNEICLENPKTSAAARALSDITVLCLPRKQALTMMQHDAAFAGAVFGSLSRKTRRLYHKVGNDTGSYTLKNRMAASIWKLTRDYSTETAQGRTVDFEVTVNFLSTLMGAKRETVSRTLSEMKKSGLILHENGILTVPDLSALRRSYAE